MKWKFYAVILLLIVPVQTTFMDHISFFDIKPDLGLVTVCLIGLKKGETDGISMGILIGTLMDLFSGGAAGINLITKPVAGWISGLVGKTFVDMRISTSVGFLITVSLITGFLIYLFVLIIGGGLDLLLAFRWTILPQALYDGLAGAVLLTLLPNRWMVKKSLSEN